MIVENQTCQKETVVIIYMSRVLLKNRNGDNILPKEHWGFHTSSPFKQIRNLPPSIILTSFAMHHPIKGNILKKE